MFPDFRNYELLMRDEDDESNTDWAKIGPSLAVAAANIVKSARPTEFQGLNFYESYGPTEQGRKRNQWATSLIGTRPGCGADMRGTEERGVDLRMATDMIKLAWVDNYDVAVLVSSDADFVPVAEFLETRGIKVIHGAFPPKGHHLSSCCWGRIDLHKLREVFRFRKGE